MIKRPMLASDADLSKIQYPVYCSPKYDGIRCSIVNGMPKTRSFKDIPNKHVYLTLQGLPNLDGELVTLKEGYDEDSCVVDGIIQEGHFNDTTSAMMSYEGEPLFVYCAFDWIGKTDLSYIKRTEMLSEISPQLPHFVKIVLPTLIDNEAELLAFAKRCQDYGLEGIIIRDGNGVYKQGRSTVKEGGLLRYKPFKDAEAEIIGFVEKMHNTNEQELDNFGNAKRSTKKEGKVPANTLGAFIVRDILTGVEFKMSGKLNDAEKQEVWNNQDQYLGRLIKYKYQRLAKDKPRHPIFIGFRSKEDMDLF